MGKVKVTLSDINLEMTSGTMMFVNIDAFRFIQDEEQPYIEVRILNDESYEFLDEIAEYAHGISDLEIIAKKWLFNHVEIK